MAAIVTKIDFSSYRGLNASKTWTVKEVSGGNIIPYNMTLKDITLQVLDRSDPPVLLYELTPTVKGNGTITFSFNATQTNQSSLVDYLMVETPLTTPTTIAYGTINFLPIGQSIPFSEIILNEIPPGVVIPESFITIKAYEWRLFLQNSITPSIPDADVQNEAAWPFLVNLLIAKLIIHDFLTKALKSNLTGTDGTGGSGNLKKLETGPANAEWYDTFSSMGDMLTVDKNGNSILTALAWDICELASRLSIYLKLCGPASNIPIIPVRAESCCNGSWLSHYHIKSRG